MISILLLSILFAGWFSRRVEGLPAYFAAQFFGTLAAVFANDRWGTASVVYGAVYVAVTTAILAAIFRIAWKCLENRARPMAMAGVLAIAVTRMAYFALGHPPTWYDWIGLVEGGTLLWAGLIVGGTAPYKEKMGVHVCLGILFLFQAGWRWGFYIHLRDWNEMNWIVSPLLPTFFFIIIGLLTFEMSPAR